MVVTRYKLFRNDGHGGALHCRACSDSHVVYVDGRWERCSCWAEDELQPSTMLMCTLLILGMGPDPRDDEEGEG